MRPADNTIAPLDRLVLSVRDACAVAACSRRTLYDAVKRGQITLTKRGRKSLVSVAQLRAWCGAPPAGA